MDAAPLRGVFGSFEKCKHLSRGKEGGGRDKPAGSEKWRSNGISLGGRILAADLEKPRWAEKHKGGFAVDIGGSAASSATEADGEGRIPDREDEARTLQGSGGRELRRGGGGRGRHREPLDRGGVQSIRWGLCKMVGKWE